MDVIDLAQQLIRTPSPVRDGDETEVAALIQRVLEQEGLPRAQVIDADPARPNLVLTLDFGSGGRHLGLCGHIDTKPVGGARWTVDPFAAEIDGDRLYGLGSGDMKAAVAAMLVAVRSLTTAGDITSGRLSLILTADEEDGAVYGARHLAETVDLGLDALVIGEPGGIHTDYDRLHVVSRGLGRFRVTAQARQGHSSLTSQLAFRNAGVDIARAVAHLANAFNPSTPANPDEVRDWEATINPGMEFTTGYGYGVLPEVMSVTVEIRTLPRMDAAQTLAELQTCLAALSQQTGAQYSVTFDDEPRHWLPGTQARAADPVVRAAQRASSTVLGSDVPLAVFPGTTDTSWFAVHHPDLPALPAFGPGLLRRAHGADEWVSVREVRRTVDLYEALVREYLNPANGDGR
ncbi:M20 family metallopeptidase [Pseudactinotalea sp. Z1739]|uniref:M20 family metallopeptidase n=1 Tax=Pseudactinotalea sp. Z1739 TaxID=3413028 RepID=UPI003C7D0861